MIAEALTRWFAVLSPEDGGASLRVGVGVGADGRWRALEAADAPPSTGAVDGRPTFARGATGSITHSSDVCVAVIDPRGRPIGVDLESLIGPDLDAAVMLAHHEPPGRSLRVVLAAKEAAGKAIAALTGAWLDPRAISLHWVGDAFAAEPPHGQTAWSDQIWGGVSLIDGERVVAVALSRRRESAPGRP